MSTKYKGIYGGVRIGLVVVVLAAVAAFFAFGHGK